MKKSLVILGLLLFTGATSLFGQELYLPVSTQSDAAVTAYHHALDALRVSNIPEARRQFAASVEADPNFFMGMAHHAMVNDFMENEAAQEMAQRSLELEPGNFTPAEAHIRAILDHHMSEGSVDEAVELYEAMAQDYPDNYHAHMMAGYFVGAVAKNKELQMEHAQAMARITPDHGPAHNALGYAHMHNGNMKKAKKAFDTYMRLSPEDPNAYDSMGDYYMANENYEMAVQHYEQAAEMGMEVSAQKADKAREMLD